MIKNPTSEWMLQQTFHEYPCEMRKAKENKFPEKVKKK